MPFTKNALETYWNLNLGENGSLEGSNISKADNKHSLSLPTTSATRIAIAHIRSRYRTTSTIKPPTTHSPSKRQPTPFSCTTNTSPSTDRIIIPQLPLIIRVYA